jgi:hypothetical protein
VVYCWVVVDITEGDFFVGNLISQWGIKRDFFEVFIKFL